MKSTARLVATGLLFALPNIALTNALAAQESTKTENAAAEAAEATAEAIEAQEPVWAFEESDVEVDTGYVFGQLENGMRYILRENGTPEGTALVRMRIDSGSLDETDEERGLSHYLEHMAFNGSTNIPEGEMIKLLEREGLAFGADTNASTGLGAITYMLNLPRNDEPLLDTALMLMRETASELTIAEDAVERERGVILAERRDRRNFAQKAREDSYEFNSPDARFADRLPIGTLEVIENATAAQMRALYERTYTPENTVLVIVGDYPTDVMEAKIREKFADWSGGPAPEDPVTGPVDIERQGLTDIYTDPALSESVAISRYGEWRDEPDTLANRDKGALRRIGYSIIGRRLSSLALGADAPFRGASYGTGNLFEDARSTGISVSSVDGEWKKGMLAAVREVNQALTYGFTQAEIDEQLINLRTAYENGVKAADTRSNGAYVGGALGLVSSETVPTTPAYRLAQFERFEKLVTPESVYQAVLEHAVPLDNPMIRFTGRTAPEGGEEALRGAFAEGMALAIAPPVETEAKQFAYTDFGTPGEVVEDSVEERTGIRRIRFANGVRLNLKQTDIREDRISVRVKLDGGSLMNTADDPLKTYLAGSLTGGGLGEHSVDELRTVLAGKSVGYSFSRGIDGFTMGSGTTPDDLDLQMKVLAAFLTDPGYRPEGVERFRKGIDNFYETLDSTPGRAISAQIGGILSDNDPLFTLQPNEAFEALDYEKLDAAIGDRLSKGALEIAMVGDLDEDAAIAAVASSFGALPEREPEFNLRKERRVRPFTSDRSVREISHTGEDDQALIRMIWPTTDDSDLTEAIKLSMLARIVRLELTDRIREDLGQAYSPSASSSTSGIYKDYGTITVNVSVDVEQIQPTRDAITAMLKDLVADAITEDVLERARKPALEAYENALKNLGGWMSLTSRAQSEPERIDRFYEAPEILKALTIEDLKATAIKYLAANDAVEFIVTPQGPLTCTEEAPCMQPDIPAE
ncbi:MAG: insulinase family protein [Pseudomonadota bacterium]